VADDLELMNAGAISTRRT